MTFSNGTVEPRKASLPSVSSDVTKKEKTDDIKADDGDNQETSWQSIYLLTAICMFCGIQFSIFFPTLWPFLHTIDSNASQTFFGFITAAFSVGQAVASPAFGYWMNKQKSIRQPLAFGTIVMIISNIVFAFTEAFSQDWRKWVMMVARFFNGLGAGTVGVMRAYASTASSLKDRARAITFVQASYIIGMTVGPGIQVAFTPINYPGVSAGPLHIDMYTTPAWFAVIVNIVSLLFLFIFLEENYAGVTEKSLDEDPYFAMPNFDIIPVAICVGTQFTLMFIITNLETVGSMYAMMMWGWDDQQAVTYTGILQAVNGAISVVVYGAFAYTLGDYVSKGRERIWTIIGLALGLIFHIATFPWPVGGMPPTGATRIHHKTNETETIGCDKSQYSWCGTTHDVNFWVYASFYSIVLAACFPIVNISMNTLFSKILGSRRQGTMQGVVLMSGSMARTIGPLIVSFLFQKKGPIPLWYIEIGILSVTIFFWIVFYRRLVPLNASPELKPYQHYNYERGRLYRI